MQKKQFKHLRQYVVQLLSPYLTSKENNCRTILTTKNTPLISEVKATLPAWNLTNLFIESPNGLPAFCVFSWLKYHIETAELKVKWLLPCSQNKVHRPPARKKARTTISD